MPTTDEILAAIPSTEPATFNEFLNALPDTPEKGDRDAWATLFAQLDYLDRMGLVEIERANKGGSIEGLMLTGEGAERARVVMNRRRAGRPTIDDLRNADDADGPPEEF